MEENQFPDLQKDKLSFIHFMLCIKKSNKLVI